MINTSTGLQLEATFCYKSKLVPQGQGKNNFDKYFGKNTCHTILINKERVQKHVLHCSL